jgi:hypothetical protein
MTRILFIEDAPAFAIGVIDRLRADGYDVRWESNGSEGITLPARIRLISSCSTSRSLVRTDSTSALICGVMAYRHPCLCSLHEER